MGYALAGVATGTVSGYTSTIVYISIYIIMNMGTFACLYLMKVDGKYTEKIEDLSGLSKEKPMLVFMNNCVNTIAQIPSIPLDKKNPEDVDTKAEDHLYDALRYGIMTRPRSSIWDYNPAKQRTGFQASDATFGY